MVVVKQQMRYCMDQLVKMSQYGWTMSTALAAKSICQTVALMDGVTITVLTVKMLE